MRKIKYFSDYNDCLDVLERLYRINPHVYNLCFLMSVSALQLSEIVLLCHDHIKEMPSGRYVIIYKDYPYIYLSHLFIKTVQEQFCPNNYGFLFPNKKGTSHISNVTAKNRIESCLRELSIEGTPSIFRLSYAYHYLKTNHTLTHSGLDHLMRNTKKLTEFFDITLDDYTKLISCEQKKCSTPELHNIYQTISDAMQIIANPICDDALHASVTLIDELNVMCNHYRKYIIKIDGDA